ncbi:MAG: hypothetical protein Q7T87_11005, partial [Polaromonas sp.]|nr:hypothetical protein [Polaromonas sp.]
ADFPIFKGWQCINDDERHDDQRCDSPRLRTMLLTGIETSQRAEILKDTAKLAGRLRDSKTIQPLMKKLICRFPTEFDRSNIDSRYGWYRESPGFMEDSTKWERLKAHITALTHADLPQAYKDAQWHFHPAEFIRMFRQCGWLSRSELVQMLPSHAVRTGKHEPSGKVGALWEAVQTNIERRNVVIELHRTPMNRMMRKHGITTPLRQASFLGNAMQETSWLSSFQEFGPNGRWYTPWHGRGYLQLTHPSNYFGYWEWQGKIFATSIKTALVNAEQTEGSKKPELRNRKAMADENFSQLTAAVLQWRSAVHGGGADVNFSEQLLAPSDSAGYYWLRSGMAAHADQPHLLERVTVSTVDDTGSRIFYRSPAFWRASAAVNLPSVVNTTYSRALNGFNSRCSGYGSALATLSEMRFPDTDARHVLEFPEGYNKRPM